VAGRLRKDETMRWRIEGFDGAESAFFSVEVPCHHLGEKQVEKLLSHLASRHLSANEIVRALLSKRESKTSILVVTREYCGGNLVLCCGESPFYSAKVISK